MSGVVSVLSHSAQEVGGTLIGKDGIVVMAGVELMEEHKTHSFNVFDAIPFYPFQPLL